MTKSPLFLGGAPSASCGAKSKAYINIHFADVKCHVLRRPMEPCCQGTDARPEQLVQMQR